MLFGSDVSHNYHMSSLHYAAAVEIWRSTVGLWGGSSHFIRQHDWKKTTEKVHIQFTHYVFKVIWYWGRSGVIFFKSLLTYFIRNWNFCTINDPCWPVWNVGTASGQLSFQYDSSLWCWQLYGFGEKVTTACVWSDWLRPFVSCCLCVIMILPLISYCCLV